MRVAFGRAPFPADAMQQVVPSYRVRRAAHYMAAMGLWQPPSSVRDSGCAGCTRLSCHDWPVIVVDLHSGSYMCVLRSVFGYFNCCCCMLVIVLNMLGFIS